MSKYLRKLATISAIRRSMKKRAPSEFEYSSDTDYYVPTIKKEDRLFLIKGITETEIQCLEWMGEKFEKDAQISVVDLGDYTLEVHRFYGYLRLDSKSAWDFWRDELTFRVQLHSLRESLRQKFYNYTTRFRHDRVQILRVLIQREAELAITKNAILHLPEGRSIIQLFSEVYGHRIYGHPAYEQECAKFRLIVGSLVSIGELEQTTKHEYKLTGSALASVAAYEESERRHQDSLTHNKRLFWLTIVLAVAATAQVAVTWIASPAH